MNIISNSCGNDSKAMLQWAVENKIPELIVTYIDAGGSAPGWFHRAKNKIITSGEY